MRFFRALIFVASALVCAAFIFPLSLLPETSRYRLCARVTQAWAKIVLKIFRITLHERPVFAYEATPRRARHSPRVIVANHVSYLDIPVLLARGPCVFVAKREVADWPIIGWIGKRTGNVFVEREKLFSRASALLDLQRRLQCGVDIVVFPEGSTSLEGPRRGLSKFHAGAFRISRMEEATVEAVYLEYDDPDRCAWLDDKPFVPHLLALYEPRGVRVNLRSEALRAVADRREQREVREYARSWLLEGGRNLRFTTAPAYRPWS